MIQDIPAEEALLALMVAEPALSIDSAFTPYCLTDHRRELSQLLGKIKIENGIPGYETLRAQGASEDALKVWDVVFHDEAPIESFTHLCKHLRKVATNRRLHEFCKHWHKKVMDPEFDAGEEIAKLETQALGFRDLYSGAVANGSGVRKGGDLAPLVAMLERTLSRSGSLLGLRTGFPRLDECLDGLNPGRLYLLGARPSVGKTSWMLSVIVNLLDGLNDGLGMPQEPTRGMIFTLEMPFDDIQMNMLVIKSKYSRQQMMKGLRKEALINLRDIMTKEMVLWDYLIDDTPSIPIDQLCHRARRAHSEKPLQWIAVDYLQLIQGSKKSSNTSRQVEIGEVSGKLKALAKELKIPIIALCQLKRVDRVLDSGKGKKVSPRPKLEDLRESGDLEQDADAVALIHRDQEGEDGVADLLLAKNRFGPLDFNIPMTFDAELSRYRPGR